MKQHRNHIIEFITTLWPQKCFQGEAATRFYQLARKHSIATFECGKVPPNNAVIFKAGPFLNSVLKVPHLSKQRTSLFCWAEPGGFMRARLLLIMWKPEIRLKQLFGPAPSPTGTFHLDSPFDPLKMVESLPKRSIWVKWATIFHFQRVRRRVQAETADPWPTGSPMGFAWSQGCPSAGSFGSCSSWEAHATRFPIG